MATDKFGPELDVSKWDFRLTELDPNWVWSRIMYYDGPLWGLGTYEGQPIFYQITDILTEEERAARNFNDHVREYVLFEASEVDFDEVRREQVEWKKADDDFRAKYPGRIGEGVKSHSEKSIKANDTTCERLRKNKVIGWLWW